MDYKCEQCGDAAALCVSDWGYIAALCDDCLKERTAYLKLPSARVRDGSCDASATSEQARVRAI
jgi:hypothetical protein